MSARAAAEETIDVALVLQGGGALGAYQVGAYAALVGPSSLAVVPPARAKPR